MGFRKAKQERSRRTLGKLLDATEELLDEKTFEEVTVQEIVARAGSSIGSFYARFPHKEALREALHVRYLDDIVAVTGQELDPANWEGCDLGTRARAFIGGVVEVCRKRRGLMRMRWIDNVTRAGSPPTEHLDSASEFAANLQAFLAPCLGEIGHEDPAVAIPFALRMIDSVIPAAILFEEPGKGSFRQFNDQQLIDETTRAFLSYLGQRNPEHAP